VSVKGVGVLGVILNSALSYAMPRRAVGRLVSKLRNPDEDTSMAAYMALVRLGPRIAPQLLEAARAGTSAGSVLGILRDQGDPGVIPALKELLASQDPEVAAAARECLDALASRAGRQTAARTS